MYNNKLFKKFCKERNIKDSTIESYSIPIKRYIRFHNCSLEELIEEANIDEEKRIPLKQRRLKDRLISFRNNLLESKLSSNTIRTYFSKIKTFYKHFEIEIPYLPEIKYEKDYVTNYLDLPTKEHIRQAVDYSQLPIKALILFMSSSGTAKAETLSLTVKDFIEATKEYHKSNYLSNILYELSQKDEIIPTIYLKRIKTDKYYYTFCSSEASKYIVLYLKSRRNLKLNDKLFPFKSSYVISAFQKINDNMRWGVKGKYRFFRTHTLRKFHASNIQLSAEYVDALQGRSKNSVHETYIKTNPDKLKEIYIKKMKNVMIFYDDKNNKDNNEEINITINIFLSNKHLIL